MAQFTVQANETQDLMIAHAVKRGNNMRTLSTKIGLYLFGLHCIGFIVTIFCIRLSTDPQAPLLWSIFAIMDFPISLLYYFTGGLYAKIVNMAGQSIFAQILYPPHIIHGLLGGIWWYYLPRLFTPKRFGGIWGKKKGAP
ncbi:MAG: hypothetical protein A4E62_00113 [Syntrophorhabdus sp. PtaU1.Bin002]|nr:MAG: hypothetical protein A4E62_00113 [Syntrophorhabdus sp. PtaU1.Bin002]